ncbi:uncharacterized protein C10orf95-like [Octodon degus]|uniref:Uncharacterized protein C10orf95-like n=1 Tax=Octodon degus TaxID=10160 RepID=A0A6P3VB59_OCTDE|nr:uncharacterized protein C10orf95-like [Octodon degus]
MGSADFKSKKPKPATAGAAGQAGRQGYTFTLKDRNCGGARGCGKLRGGWVQGRPARCGGQSARRERPREEPEARSRGGPACRCRLRCCPPRPCATPRVSAEAPEAQPWGPGPRGPATTGVGLGARVCAGPPTGRRRLRTPPRAGLRGRGDRSSSSAASPRSDGAESRLLEPALEERLGTAARPWAAFLTPEVSLSETVNESGKALEGGPGGKPSPLPGEQRSVSGAAAPSSGRVENDRDRAPS